MVHKISKTVKNVHHTIFLFNLRYIHWPLCLAHLFNCSLLQILYLIGQSHGSKPWLKAFRHPDMARTAW